jgi:putative flippase GtrA
VTIKTIIAIIIGIVIGAVLMRLYDVRYKKRKRVSIDTYAKMVTTIVMIHGMILTTWSYILSWNGFDPVVDVSSTIVREIVAPVITYLATNTIMNIFEKNKLSFSVPLNSTVVRNDGTTLESTEAVEE